MHLAAPRTAPRDGRGMSALRLLSPHEALLGPGRDLPHRRPDLAGQLEGQQHLPVLRQPARRAAAGLDHRPHRHRHDGGDPDRRHRPLGRLAHGDLLGRLRDAADHAGLDAGRRHGRPGARARRLRRRLPRSTRFVFAQHRRRSARRRPAARAPLDRDARPRAAAGRRRCRWRRCRSGSCCRRSRPSSACSACCSSRPASACCSARSTASSSSAAACSHSSSRSP